MTVVESPVNGPTDEVEVLTIQYSRPKIPLGPNEFASKWNRGNGIATVQDMYRDYNTLSFSNREFTLQGFRANFLLYFLSATPLGFVGVRLPIRIERIPLASIEKVVIKETFLTTVFHIVQIHSDGRREVHAFEGRVKNAVRRLLMDVVPQEKVTEIKRASSR